MTLTRRRTLLGLTVAFLPLPAGATPEEVADNITRMFGDGPMTEGPITLDLPALAETGNSVPLTVRVDSPMTADDRIARLAIFTEDNPRPVVMDVTFGPGAAEAVITTNIRMAGTQNVVCVAEKGDGTLMKAAREVRVVVGACTTLPGRY